MLQAEIQLNQIRVQRRQAEAAFRGSWKQLMAVVGLLILVLGSLSGCHHGEAPAEAEPEEAAHPVAVQAMTVEPVTLRPTLDLVGTLQAIPEQTAGISPQLGGWVVKLAVVEGQSVQAGEILVQLDDRAAKAGVERAKALVTEKAAALVSGGRRVYRRMLTWTITKIARTVELAALLTFGYLTTGVFVTPLFLIVLIIVMNDIVTITIATDRAWVSPVPERWNVRAIAQVAGVLAAGWLVLGFALLWGALSLLKLPFSQVQTLTFIYLIASAQTTIYLTRVPGRIWSLPPSRSVAAITIGNVIVASILGYGGILMAPVSAVILVGTLATVLVTALLLNEVKIWIFQSTGILGRRA